MPVLNLTPDTPALSALLTATDKLNADGTYTPCYGRDEFTSAKRETRESVAHLCLACPVRDLCAAAGREAGVDLWGGRDWAPSPNSTHCRRGHEWTEETAIRDSRGRRQCAICVDERATTSRVCVHGHHVTPETGYITANGMLACSECAKARSAARSRGGKRVPSAQSVRKAERMKRLKKSALAHPDWGYRRHAEALGMPPGTVRQLRTELLERGEIPPLTHDELGRRKSNNKRAAA